MNENNSKLISLILGGLALLLSVLGIVCVGFNRAGGWLAFFGILVGIAAVIFSAYVSKNNNGKNGAIGMLMGFAAIVIGIVISISCLVCSCTCGGDYRDNYYDNRRVENAVSHWFS